MAYGKMRASREGANWDPNGYKLRGLANKLSRCPSKKIPGLLKCERMLTQEYIRRESGCCAQTSHKAGAEKGEGNSTDSSGSRSSGVTRKVKFPHLQETSSADRKHPGPRQ